MHLDLAITTNRGISTVEIRRAPHNFFDVHLIADLASALEALDRDPTCRAVIIGAEGSAFCAGADLSKDVSFAIDDEVHPLYREALRIFACRKPLVAAVHGAAVGGGLGLALACDFRVTCAEAKFSANFAALGVHAGFGLSVTLPRLVGTQYAALMLYTARRIGGAEAVQRGLADVLTDRCNVRDEAYRLASEIATNSPLAVQSMRETLRMQLLPSLKPAMTRETSAQSVHFRTADFGEGVAAMSQRRPPRFTGA